MRALLSKLLLLLSCIIALSCSPSKEGEVKIIRNPEKGLWEGDPSKQFNLIEDLVIGKEKGDENYVFARIVDVVIDRKGNIYVLDYFNRRIQKFDNTGKHLLAVGRPGRGPGEFEEPMAMTIDASNNLYVVDPALDRVSKFDTTGKFITSFQIENLSSPVRSINMDSRGNFYLTYFNFSNRKIIHKFDPHGRYLLSFCDSYGKNKNIDLRVERFYAGGKIYIDKNDIVHFTQLIPYEIRRFSTQGRLLSRIFRKNSFMSFPDVKMQGESITFYVPTASDAIIILDDGKFINSVLKPRSHQETIIDLFDKEGNLLISRCFKRYMSLKCRDAANRIYVVEDQDYPKVVRYVIVLE